MPKLKRRRNPTTGTHPDLFLQGGKRYAETMPPGESPIFVPLASLTPEQLVELPRSSFTDAEWNELDGDLQQDILLNDVEYQGARAELAQRPRASFSDEKWDELDEELQEQIYENDKASQARIEAFARIFIQRFEWENDGTSRDYSSVEEGFEQWLADRAGRDDLWEVMPRRVLQEIINAARAQGYDYDNDTDHRRAIREAINEVMSDNNHYEHDGGSGRAVYSEELRGSIYLDESDWAEKLEPLFPDELTRALELIKSETNNELDLDESTFTANNRRHRSVEHDWDLGETYDMYADWDAIEQAVAEKLEEGAPGNASEEYEELAAKPPEERVVHRWPDGFYVQDLLAEELPEEGKIQGICVGRPDMGYDKAVRKGEIKIFSLRRPSGKPLFTLEMELTKGGKVLRIEQIKGKANRLPGFDLGKVGENFPIKRDEVQRLYEFIEGPLSAYTTSNGIAADDVRDFKPAADQVNKLFHQGDKWAVKLLRDLGVEAAPPEKPEWGRLTVPVTALPPPRDNPGKRCGTHGQGCTGFCAPYRRRAPAAATRRNPAHVKGGRLVVSRAPSKLPRVEIFTPERAAAAIDKLIGKRAYEAFIVLYLNTRNQLIGYEELTEDSLASVSVNVPSIVRNALLAGAGAVITAHNHPSGKVDPSVDDQALWLALRAAAQPMKLAVLDNLIVGGTGLYYSESDGVQRRWSSSS